MRHDLLKLADESTAALDPTAPVDQVLAALEFVAALKEAARQLAERVEARAIDWIGVNGEIESGDTRYYVAPNKTTKCRDLAGTLRATLEATGGDFDATVMSLSSGAFKPGACREILPPDVFDDLFVTEVANEVKTGKPRKRLQKVNAKYLK